ncbi:hypothetical protein CC2G_012399 [Coprinopsis cinerea AmutBmut pab1-1]|nr:hypothetical protein CC2G_012399 [Coprinopsis cinerea AmutBmut pab1-1]
MKVFTTAVCAVVLLLTTSVLGSPIDAPKIEVRSEPLIAREPQAKPPDWRRAWR